MTPRKNNSSPGSIASVFSYILASDLRFMCTLLSLDVPCDVPDCVLSPLDAPEFVLLPLLKPTEPVSLLFSSSVEDDYGCIAYYNGVAVLECASPVSSCPSYSISIAYLHVTLKTIENDENSFYC